MAQPVLALPLGHGATPGLTDQWYIGLGGGVSFLQPNPVEPTIDPIEEQGSYAKLSIGRDLSRLVSLQFQFHALGAIELSDEQEVDYSAVDAALLYRFYDTRDGQLVPTQFGLALYGIAGLGGISRETDTNLELKQRSEFYLSYGLGAEIFLNRYFSFRFQGAIVDKDAQYASLSLVTRFGGNQAQSRNRLKPPESDTQYATVPADEIEEPTSIDTVPATQVPAPIDQLSSTPLATTQLPANPLPSAPASSGVPSESKRIEDLDSDKDGVADLQDRCNDSTPGFPVKADGCALFNGVLSAVEFEANSARLLPESRPQLDALANLLKNYPASRIQILVHTDTSISETERAILSRGRIRTLGTYLLSRGIRANRLILRSMGGSVPVSDNSTPEGRAINNRIELLEYR